MRSRLRVLRRWSTEKEEQGGASHTTSKAHLLEQLLEDLRPEEVVMPPSVERIYRGRIHSEFRS